MSKRYNFTDFFQKEIQKILAEKYGNTTKRESDISTEIKAPVDLYCKDKTGKEYLIELEIHRADPSNNIAKIAYWLHEDNKPRKIIVLQFFSPHYDLRIGTSAKKKESEYIGRVLIEQTHCQKYYSISLDDVSKQDFNEVYLLI